MNLGLFSMPIHMPDRNLAEALSEDRELVVLADKVLYITLRRPILELNALEFTSFSIILTLIYPKFACRKTIAR